MKKPSALPDHRRPPMPHWEVPKGCCRWCGDFIWREDGQLNGRAHWHPHCVETYKAAAWPQHARHLVYQRDRGRCTACGKSARRRWEMDHIVPLIDGGGFDLDNLQTLCPACHRGKTAEEARQRAAQRRQPAPEVDGAMEAECPLAENEGFPDTEPCW